jgi:5-methylcytosine-specific restriction endonuclease McrA
MDAAEKRWRQRQQQRTAFLRLKQELHRRPDGTYVTDHDFLTSPEWRDARQACLDRWGYNCLRCGRFDRHMNADHVKPRKLFPELALDVGNLQPLCADCNKWKGNKTIDYRNKFP